MPPIELLTVVIGVILIGMHLGAATVFWRRLRAGRNGITLALLLHMLVVSLVLTVNTAQAGEPWRMAGRLALLATVTNLVISARIEARRPLRKTSAVMRRVWRDFDER